MEPWNIVKWIPGAAGAGKSSCYFPLAPRCLSSPVNQTKPSDCQQGVTVREEWVELVARVVGLGVGVAGGRGEFIAPQAHCRFIAHGGGKCAEQRRSPAIKQTPELGYLAPAHAATTTWSRSGSGSRLRLIRNPSHMAVRAIGCQTRITSSQQYSFIEVL